jgi:hypothetical protein
MAGQNNRKTFIKNLCFGLIIIPSGRQPQPGFISLLPQIGMIVIENSRFFH